MITTVSRPEQANLAKAERADHVINYKTEDVVERIKQITGANDRRRVDHIVDVNFAANLPVLSAVIRPNSTIVSYSSFNPDDSPPFPFLTLQLLNIIIRPMLVHTMPEAAIRDIATALEARALHHTIAQRGTVNLTCRFCNWALNFRQLSSTAALSDHR